MIIKFDRQGKLSGFFSERGKFLSFKTGIPGGPATRAPANIACV